MDYAEVEMRNDFASEAARMVMVMVEPSTR
jgi:hypothetical protein